LSRGNISIADFRFEILDFEYHIVVAQFIEQPDESGNYSIDILIVDFRFIPESLNSSITFPSIYSGQAGQIYQAVSGAKRHVFNEVCLQPKACTKYALISD
jgi:hypothetical protein